MSIVILCYRYSFTVISNLVVYVIMLAIFQTTSDDPDSPVEPKDSLKFQVTLNGIFVVINSSTLISICKPYEKYLLYSIIVIFHFSRYMTATGETELIHLKKK